MTVKELIDILERLPEDYDVVITDEANGLDYTWDVEKIESDTVGKVVILS